MPTCRKYTLGAYRYTLRPSPRFSPHPNSSSHSRSSSSPMDKLTSMFSRLLPPQMSDYAEQIYHNNMSVQNAHIRVIPPDPRAERGPLFDGIDEYGGIDTILKQMMNSFAKNQTPSFPIPQRLPCANVEVEKYKTCDNPGTMACSGCKLVSYCSKVLFFQFWFRFFLIQVSGMPEISLARS